MTIEEKVSIIVKALDEKKAKDIEIIDISSQSILGSYIIIATGTSSTHVSALSDEVDFRLSQLGTEPHHIEGRQTPWTLLDYSDIMVHIFMKDARNFYALERLWSDGKTVDIENFLK